MTGHGVALELPLSTIYLMKYSVPDWNFCDLSYLNERRQLMILQL